MKGHSSMRRWGCPHGHSALLFVGVWWGAWGCGGGRGAPDASAALPPLSAELPTAADSMGVRRGLAPARGIVHLHSPYSHDACDGEPRDPGTGAVDEACLSDLRTALCRTRIDYAALTDHDDSMADEEFDALFSVRADDALIPAVDDPDRDPPITSPVASKITCPDGHEVLVFVGGENDLMPIMLDRHPDGTPAERHAIYDANDAQTGQLFRDLGGLLWIAHSEGRTLEELRQLSPDGIEIYNLHANIDPDIRADDLGLPAAGAIQAVAQFADTSEDGPEPDLALLSFVLPNQVALDHWDALLGEGRRVWGTAGTDAHQNALPIALRDGERGDSYRRMLRWFSNVALAPAATTDDAARAADIEAAVAAGRVFVAFELFGTPVGFDAVAARQAAEPVEMGGTVTVADGALLVVGVPEVFALDASLPAPEIRARVLRLDASGRTEVAVSTDRELSVPLDAPGAYRVEVLITPRHLGPYLGRLGPEDSEREHVWIYANPIFVEP